MNPVPRSTGCGGIAGEWPAVSVVMPTFNQADYVGESLESVLGQGYPNIEIVVVNDGSTDETGSLLKHFGTQVTVVFQENRGPAAARNRGIRESSGEFIAFLDADDSWPDGKVFDQVAPLLQDSSIDMTLSRVRRWELGSDGGGAFCLSGSIFYSLQLGSVVARKSVFEKVGYFDEGLALSEDQDWFLRARESGVRMARVESVGLHYRVHAESATRSPGTACDLGLPRVLKQSLDRRRGLGGSCDPESLISISEIPVWKAGL